MALRVRQRTLFLPLTVHLRHGTVPWQIACLIRADTMDSTVSSGPSQQFKFSLASRTGRHISGLPLKDPKQFILRGVRDGALGLEFECGRRFLDQKNTIYWCAGTFSKRLSAAF